MPCARWPTRLYGLEVYVDRALVLSGLTVVLGGLYVAAVLGMSRLLGQDVQLGIALPATALVVVAFQPLRDRIGRSVNRLLHGQRDEPYAAISTLGRRLGAAMPPEQVLPVIVETIADSLRLPYVAVELADEQGAPAAVHGTPVAGVALRLPLVHAGERVGTLLIGSRAHGERLGDADRRLLEDFAGRASAAASGVALSVEVQRARIRLVSAREEERRRLRGDLHDGLGPTLAGAVLTIDAARRVLASDPGAADGLLDQAAATVEGSVSDIRRLVYRRTPSATRSTRASSASRQAGRLPSRSAASTTWCSPPGARRSRHAGSRQAGRGRQGRRGQRPLVRRPAGLVRQPAGARSERRQDDRRQGARRFRRLHRRGSAARLRRLLPQARHLSLRLRGPRGHEGQRQGARAQGEGPVQGQGRRGGHSPGRRHREGREAARG